MAIENSRLYEDIERLFEGFVTAAVTAIVNGTLKIEQQKGYKHLTQAAAKGNETDYLQALAIAMKHAEAAGAQTITFAGAELAKLIAAAVDIPDALARRIRTMVSD